MRYSILGLLSLLGHATSAQSWAAAGQPGKPSMFQEVVSNAAKDTIYIMGDMWVDQQLDPFWNAPLRYCNSQWDTLGYIKGTLMTGAVYRDTLFVAGNLVTVDGQPCTGGVAYWDESTGWHPAGDLGNSVRQLRVFDDELYAVGGFLEADGTPSQGVAKRVGNTWVGIGQIADPNAFFIDIAKYNGTLVVIGAAFVNGLKGIMYLNGNDWLPLGPGIQGGTMGARSLMVYNGDLYVGGQFNMSGGNAGQDIMRWDGTQFHPLGLGLQRQLGNFTSFSDAERMVVHDGLLWVGGGFFYAGGVPAAGVAIWDGTQWCGVPGDLTTGGGVHNMDFYYDTLFVSCGWTVDGDSVWQAAMFIGSNYVDTCSGPVGQQEHLIPASEVFVTFGQDTWTFWGLSAGQHDVQLHDMSGRCVWLGTVRSTQGTGTIPAVGGLSGGVYSLSVNGRNVGRFVSAR